MKKHVFGRKLKRDANERKALFKNLLTSLVLQERIKTTEAKAKAIKAQADKLITKAKKAESTDKKGSEKAYKLLHPDVGQVAVVKLIKDLGPRFAKRQGGYTRIVKLGKRRVADNAEMVIIEWTEAPAKQDTLKTKKLKQAKKEPVKVKVEKPKKEAVKPAISAKPEEKQKKPGFLKQLVTRQKKG